ncbi:transcriptional regulator, Sir2 family protein [Histomonas meleagridis]|uniref:transcriptional regulator, Sir2 family protein n=1 Tax=Histomonas meleagridis TaxID=135588 RepID=UPI00355A366A|nr:transcriptional regulator, Sir2 family protein [Histomonas meleagridis]
MFNYTKVSPKMTHPMKPKLIKGLSSLDFDGLISYIKNGFAQNTVFLTGAGASVAAGIPDFRSPGTGVYSNLEKYNLPYPEAPFSIDYFDNNPAPFFEIKQPFLSGDFKPVAPHYMATLFDRHDLLLRLYTQNVDGLDRKAGVSEDKLVECHGTYSTNTCRNCGDKSKHEDYLEEFKTGKVVYCKKCGIGVVKPDSVLFGESLPKRFYHLYPNDFASADLLIVIGTSLKVTPCSLLPGYCRKDCLRVLINKEPVATYEEKVSVDERRNVLVDLAENSHKELFKFGHVTNRRDIFPSGRLRRNMQTNN